MTPGKNALAQKPWFQRMSRISGLSTIIPLAILVILLSFAHPNFLTSDNLFGILRQAAVYAIMAVGMTFVIITGGIDLSQGSALAFSHIIAAYLLNNGQGSIALAIIAAIAVGSLLGLAQGALIAFVGLPPFIVTMAFMNILRGLSLVITDGRQIQATYEPFRRLGVDYLLGIPIPVYLFIIVAAIGHFILSSTATGRYIFALGSNEAAAKLSGVNVLRIKLLVYTFSGACVGFASAVYLSRLGAAQPTAGLNYEMESIAATVIGGTSMAGGEGGIVGSIIGAIFVAVIRNGMVMLNISTYFQQVVIGALIVFAVTLDLVRKRVASKKTS